MYLRRKLNIYECLEKKSHFLFGPRQTGKTSLIENEVLRKGVHYVNLLDHDTYLRLAQRPTRLREEIDESHHYVVIDEIQRLPHLLDEVHLLIEKRKINFLLSGSSARKLRKAGVNLLGGRARSRALHPLSLGGAFVQI
jgi:predicted AAA+ superfamily ATPase